MSDQTAIIVAGIGLAGVVLAGLAGFGGALLGARVAADATNRAAAATALESQADRAEAQRARAEDRQEVRTTRFADRKLELVVDLLLAADTHRQEATDHVRVLFRRWSDETDHGPPEEPEPPPPPVGATDPVRRAALALELIAPGCSEAGFALYSVTGDLGRLAAAWVEPHGGNEYGDRWSKEWNEALEQWADARYGFVAAVRADLDVNASDRVPA